MYGFSAYIRLIVKFFLDVYNIWCVLDQVMSESIRCWIDEYELKTKLYDKRDHFTFPIVNVLLISSNITASPANRIFIWQLIRYTRACSQYSDFLDRAHLLTKIYLNNAMLLLGWDHCYNNYMVVMTIWLTLRNIHISNENVSLTFYMVVMTIWLPLPNVHISNDNVPLTFYVYIFFPLSLPLTFTGLTFDMNNTTGVL